MAIYSLDGQAPDLPADGRYWIAETAVVIGRVRLRQDASIWWGSVLRGEWGFRLLPLPRWSSVLRRSSMC